MIDILNRNAVKSYANLMLQLFPAVCLCSVQTGHPFPRSLPPSPLLTRSPTAASSLRKVGVCANDVTLHAWEQETYRDGWMDGSSWAKGLVGNGVLCGCMLEPEACTNRLIMGVSGCDTASLCGACWRDRRSPFNPNLHVAN